MHENNLLRQLLGPYSEWPGKNDHQVQPSQICLHVAARDQSLATSIPAPPAHNHGVRLDVYDSMTVCGCSHNFLAPKKTLPIAPEKTVLATPARQAPTS